MKVGLIGSGYWAETVHCPALTKSDQVAFIGVWGRDQEKTKLLASKFDVKAYTDLDALIYDVDALDFAIPPDVQTDIAVRAAAAGKHLLLEKPVALNLHGAEEVLHATTQAGVSTLVFHTMLFQTDISEWIDGHRNIDWVSGTAEWVADALTAPKSPFRESPWRKERGALWDLGPHVLSVFISLLGPVYEVTAIHGRADTVHLILIHAEGRTSSATLSLNGPPDNSFFNIKVWNSELSALVPESKVSPSNALVSALGVLASHVAGNSSAPRSDITLGRNIVAVLESAQCQLDSRKVS